VFARGNRLFAFACLGSFVGILWLASYPRPLVQLAPVIGIPIDWHGLLNLAISVATLAIGGVIAHALHTPKDLERAQLLQQIAGDAAAYVVSTNPAAPWALMLADVVRKISTAAGLPTSNSAAIERAAAGALVSLGVKPK
jgi:hypothetical protein